MQGKKASHKKYNHGKYNAQKWNSFLEEAEKRQETGQYDDYKKAFLSSMQQYKNTNSDKLFECLAHYKEAISQEFFEEHYVLLNGINIKSVLSRCKVMVLTANPIEKAIFHFMAVRHSSEKIRELGDVFFY